MNPENFESYLLSVDRSAKVERSKLVFDICHRLLFVMQYATRRVDKDESVFILVTDSDELRTLLVDKLYDIGLSVHVLLVPCERVYNMVSIAETHKSYLEDFIPPVSTITVYKGEQCGKYH